MSGAHLVDNVVGSVLHLHGLFHLSCLHQLIHLEEQLRHHAVGSADTGLRSDDAAADKLLVRTIEDDVVIPACQLEHLDVLYRHGGILDTDDPRVLPHLGKQALCQGHTCQLRDVVDNEIRVGSCLAHGIPVSGNCILRQMEVDGRNGCDGINAKALRMLCQLHTVLCIIAAHMCDNGQLALGNCHHIFQCNLAVLQTLVDALS